MVPGMALVEAVGSPGKRKRAGSYPGAGRMHLMPANAKAHALGMPFEWCMLGNILHIIVSMQTIRCDCAIYEQDPANAMGAFAKAGAAVLQ